MSVKAAIRRGFESLVIESEGCLFN
jgi:hypothetical protein